MAQGARGSGLVAAGLGWGIALGVALGSLLIAPAVNGTLEDGPFSEAKRTGGAAESDTEASEARSAEAEAAERQSEGANKLLAGSSTRLVSGALTDVPVTVIRTADAADEDVSAVRWLANAAGATKSGAITLTDRFLDRESADELSSIIANTLPAGAQLSVDNLSPGTHAGESLGAALALDAATGGGAASAPDRELVLDALKKAGFIEVDGQVEPAGAILVVAGDPAADGKDGFAAQTLTDFTAGLNKSAAAVLATRGAAPDKNAVSDVDTEAGRISAVLAAADTHGKR